MQPATVEKVSHFIGSQPRQVSVVNLDAVNEEFARVRGLTPGVTGLLLSTADGRALASSVEGSGVDARRLAAMANSYLTLGETLAKELELSGAEYATICTGRGNIVLFRVHAAKPLTLTAMAGPETTLAVLLFAARECATRLRLIPFG